MVDYSLPNGLRPGMVTAIVAIALSFELNNKYYLYPSFKFCFEGVA